VRLSPPEEGPSAATEMRAADPSATPESPGGTAGTEPSAPRSPGLKLLGQEHLLPGEESRGTRKRAGGPGPGGSGAGRGELS
jgi:hypothetical protein